MRVGAGWRAKHTLTQRVQHTHAPMHARVHAFTRTHSVFTNTNLRACMHPHRCDQEGALDPATFNYAMRKQIIHYSQRLLAHRMQVMMSWLMKIVENEKMQT